MIAIDMLVQVNFAIGNAIYREKSTFDIYKLTNCQLKQH